MIGRLVNPLKSDSFFIFGARGVGKSTYIQKQFAPSDRNNIWKIDLLDDDVFERYSRSPFLMEADWKALTEKPEWVFIDEIQKVPSLLNHIHRMIENNKQKFILTGSSARKLKRIGANLLAGRAFLNYMYPLTYLELKSEFDLKETLHWGTLPKIMSCQNQEQKIAFLRSYVQAYLKEEILVEQAVRQLEPFRDFIEIAAQMNGHVLNFSSVGKDVGVDDKTIKNYYSILEDTLIGFYLRSYHRSIRKGQTQHPKFYFFDIGIKRAVERSLQDTYSQGSFAFGNAFEHFIILEAYRLNSYKALDYRMSYYRTKEGKEIDLILSRGRKTIAIEIKSNTKIAEDEVKNLEKLGKEIGATELYYLSLDPHESMLGKVLCLPWNLGLKKIFI